MSEEYSKFWDEMRDTFIKGCPIDIENSIRSAIIKIDFMKNCSNERCMKFFKGCIACETVFPWLCTCPDKHQNCGCGAARILDCSLGHVHVKFDMPNSAYTVVIDSSDDLEEYMKNLDAVFKYLNVVCSGWTVKC